MHQPIDPPFANQRQIRVFSKVDNRFEISFGSTFRAAPFCGVTMEETCINSSNFSHSNRKKYNGNLFAKSLIFIVNNPTVGQSIMNLHGCTNPSSAQIQSMIKSFCDQGLLPKVSQFYEN